MGFYRNGASLGAGRLANLAMALLAIFLPAKFAAAQSHAPLPSVALYYGATPPIDALKRFDIVVLDPDAQFDPRTERDGHTAWYAYVSVGEVHPNRSYYQAIPKAWRPSENKDWASDVIDQTAPGWPAFFVDKVVAPLWKKGYRGFFLDTLDSFQLISKTDAQRAAQKQGLERVVRLLASRYPKAKLIFNRGFEILPDVHSSVQMVAFESLYQGWNASKKEYVDVPQADRDWLLGQVNIIQGQYKIPIIAIDYCAPDDVKCRKETVIKITEHGFIPYVTDAGLNDVGLGNDQTADSAPGAAAKPR
ncbi:endo alpha-1,4 polygalactosaminidase [Robbsia sp. KACC 23696]|uniref:endo alpha-1,4 polygalactosaminidase n=1 Tax=Robbsia sp. KACC 23696 TaxID=3149231 RepID=UPI00325BFC70